MDGENQGSNIERGDSISCKGPHESENEQWACGIAP